MAYRAMAVRTSRFYELVRVSICVLSSLCAVVYDLGRLQRHMIITRTSANVSYRATGISFKHPPGRTMVSHLGVTTQQESSLSMTRGIRRGICSLLALGCHTALRSHAWGYGKASRKPRLSFKPATLYGLLDPTLATGGPP